MRGLESTAFSLLLHTKRPPPGAIHFRLRDPYKVAAALEFVISPPPPAPACRGACRGTGANRCTWISCYAALTKVACAAFGEESRMKFANAAKLDKKSGVAQRRDP